MTIAEDIAARKAAQEQEGRLRQDPEDDRGQRAPDPRTDLTADTTGEADPPDLANGNDDGGDPPPQERTGPVHMSPSDQMRANIAKRFRRDDDGKVPFNGDPNDPEMLYGKHGRPAEEQVDPVEPEPEPAPAPQPQEPLHTIIVRGKEMKLTTAQLLERASKVEAADSYLEESKDLLKQAAQLRKDNNRERDPADPHRPEGRNNTQDDLTDPSLSADPQHPEDELEGAIEEVRYGTDPKEAAKKLRTVLSKEADTAADKRQLQRLLGNDNAKSTKAMKAFIEANPDLANDEIAAQVMEQQIYAIQRDELKEMGIDESKLPKDGQTIARWHQFQRVHGHPVSSQEQILEKAKGKFVQWKGGNPSPQQPKPRKEAPRVEVSVNRNERRAAIPNQPTRSMAPPQQVVNRQDSNSGQPRVRSDIIMGMRKQRGQV